MLFRSVGPPPPGTPPAIVDADMRLVSVTVTYTPLTAQGVSPVQKPVTVTMVIAKR